MTLQTGFVRYQARDADQRGRFLGVFSLVNALARQGELTPAEERFRRTNNDWYDAAYPEPTAVDPTVYDHTINPRAAGWFKTTAQHLLARVDGYLAILDAHHVPWVRVEAPTPPGKVVYEDEYQIVVLPIPNGAPRTRDERDPVAGSWSVVRGIPRQGDEAVDAP